MNFDDEYEDYNENKDVEEVEFSIEDVIVNNIERAQYYFPRLTKYLMEKTSTMNLTNKQAFLKHQYLEYFLYYLCTMVEVNDDFIKCIDYVTERLKPEAKFNKTYLQFTDGYLHNGEYNEALVMQCIADAGYVFESFFIELEEETYGAFDFGVFRNYAIKIMKNLTKSCKIDEEIYSNEYYEYCFMAASLNTLQLGIEYEKENQNNQAETTDEP